MQVAYNMNKLPWKKKVILKYCGNIIVEKKMPVEWKTQ